MKIYPQGLTFSLKPQIWSFHLVNFADNGNKRMHVQSMQSYCFCSLKMQICEVLIAVAVIVAKAPYYCFFILFEFKTKVETCWAVFWKNKYN